MAAATEATLFRICDQSNAVARMRHDPRLSRLSPRQMEVAYLVAMGIEDGYIASELGVHVQTVRFHCHRIYQRLGMARAPGCSHLRVQLALLVWSVFGGRFLYTPAD